MNKVQKSESFILPVLNMDYDKLKQNGLITTYMGYESDKWGESLFLMFDESQLQDEEFRGELLWHDQFFDTWRVDNSSFIFVEYCFTTEQKEKIVNPFLRGEYSKIDKKYVKQNFKKATKLGGRLVESNNWKILHKDPRLRLYWEERIGVKLPTEAEVWSRPEKEDEIYSFNK